MNVYPAGAEPDSDDEDGELPAFIAEQLGHHGFNVIIDKEILSHLYVEK